MAKPKRQFLLDAIGDESKDVKKYKNKPKGLNGRIDKIASDEARHKKTLMKISKEQSSNLGKGYQSRKY